MNPHLHPQKESEKEKEVYEVEEEEAKMMLNCKVMMDPEVLLKLISHSNEEF